MGSGELAQDVGCPGWRVRLLSILCGTRKKKAVLPKPRNEEGCVKQLTGGKLFCCSQPCGGRCCCRGRARATINHTDLACLPLFSP